MEVVREWDQATKKKPGGFKKLPERLKTASPAQLASRALAKMASSLQGVPQLPSLVGGLSGGASGPMTVAQAAPKVPSVVPTAPAASPAAPGAAGAAPAASPAQPQPQPGWDLSKSNWMRPVG